MKTKPPYTIVPIDDALRQELQPIINGSWASPLLAINGRLWDTRTMDGYAAVDGFGNRGGRFVVAAGDHQCGHPDFL